MDAVTRRFVIPVCAVLAAAGVLALLAYAVSSHADTASIDAKVARHDYGAASW